MSKNMDNNLGAYFGIEKYKNILLDKSNHIELYANILNIHETITSK